MTVDEINKSELFERSEWGHLPSNVREMANEVRDQNNYAAIGLSSDNFYYVLSMDRDTQNVKIYWKEDE